MSLVDQEGLCVGPCDWCNFTGLPCLKAKRRARSPRCSECGRVFDLLDDNDMDELVNGHDCE